MDAAATDRQPRTPLVVATGFTSAILGDERTLREFVMGDHVARSFEKSGRNVALYLINDSYDPLNARQLRLGVNKDPEMIATWSGFCGRPIAEVPDPFLCHESYADHFLAALLERLHVLEIHPVAIDSYRAYRAGDYAPFIATTIRNYHEIQQALRAEFPELGALELLRIQCPSCSCLDATSIARVLHGVVTYACRRCGVTTDQSDEEIRAKLTWKLDCAARWNLYGIAVETFAKAHVSALGTVSVATFISQHFFGGVVPAIARYGHLRLARDCAGRLLAALPPALFKRLLTENPARDLFLTRDSVESFGRRADVRPGLTFVDYVRAELPRQAIRGPANGVPRSAAERREDALVAYGNRFSDLFYGKSFGPSLPDAAIVETADRETARLAREAIARALELRRTRTMDPETVRAEMKHYLAAQPRAPELHPYLRRILRQEGGPAIATLLALLPEDHLNAVHAMLVFFTAEEWRASAAMKEVEP